MPETDRPRRRADLTVLRRQVGDEVFYVIADPRTGEYVRLGEVEHTIFDLLDGSRTISEIAAAFEERTGSSIDLADLAEFLEGLAAAELVESSGFDPAQILHEFRERERSGLSRRRLVSGSVALLRLLPFNPDRQLGQIAHRIRWCWSRSAFVLSMALMLAAMVLSVVSWGRLGPAVGDFVKAIMTGDAPDLARRLVLTYVMASVMMVIHEAAHGVTLKHFGGTVPEMGFALFYFMFPGAYTDTTASYLLPSRFQRVMVSLAGGYTGLVIASAAVFVWWATEAGQFVNEVALLAMILGGPPTVIFNWNPLLPYDGYYMATDISEAPNLMPRSFAYLGDLIRTKVFRVSPAHPRPPVRLRRLYVVYGALAWSYQAYWVTLVPYAAFVLFSTVAGETGGAVLAGIVTVRFARFPLATLRRFFQAVRAERRGWLSKRRGPLSAASASLAAAVLAVLFVPACPLHVHGRGTLHAAERAEVRAKSSGFVREVLALDGSHVVDGEPLVRLEDRDLAARLEMVRIERDRVHAEIVSDEGRGDASAAAGRRAQREQLGADLDLLGRRLHELTLESPAEGYLIAPRLEDRVGTYLKEGDLWCEVARGGSLRVEIGVGAVDLGDVTERSRVVAMNPGFPGERFVGRVTKVPEQVRPQGGTLVAQSDGGVPAASALATYTVEAVVDGGGKLRQGMVVEVRVEGRRMSLAGRAIRAAVRLMRGKLLW